MNEQINEIKVPTREDSWLLLYIFQISKRKGERGSGVGSYFCRSSANTQRSKMSAHHPGCGGEPRQEIKQLHPSYLLNSSSLEDTRVEIDQKRHLPDSALFGRGGFKTPRSRIAHTRPRLPVIIRKDRFTGWHYYTFPASSVSSESQH